MSLISFETQKETEQVTNYIKESGNIFQFPVKHIHRDSFSNAVKNFAVRKTCRRTSTGPQDQMRIMKETG